MPSSSILHASSFGDPKGLGPHNGDPGAMFNVDTPQDRPESFVVVVVDAPHAGTLPNPLRLSEGTSCRSSLAVAGAAHVVVFGDSTGFVG